MNTADTMQEIQKYIKQIDGFLTCDVDNELISFSEMTELKRDQENMCNLHRKLETNELEVAVVGLEKAGKSMFSSAFVNVKGLFPSADERCTFTSTRLQYGEKDRAIVEFYSRSEFESNFKKMLDEVKFPNGSLGSTTLSSFNTHFESLKNSDNATYLMHSSKTEYDIKDIIEGRVEITRLLDRSNEEFNDFGSLELKQYIINPHISRAVKNVSFYSSNLKGLENIILYDVPGFDSPTQVHMRQTIKKLQDVDAIIMVKNIKMPSLKGGEVDILVQNSDMDGIKLHEKLFVFGSYADNVGSLEQLENNKSKLADDLRKSLKEPFSLSRLFTGCLDSAYESNLEKIGSSTQLEQLKIALEAYNKNERKQILQKRTNQAINKVKEIFNAIINRNKQEQNDFGGELQELFGELLDTSRARLSEDLSHFINTEKEKVTSAAPFSSELKSKVDEVMPVLDELRLNSILAKIKAPDTRGSANYEELNIVTRKEITREAKDNFIDLIRQIAQKKQDEIEKESVRIMLNGLGVEFGHAKYTEIEVVVKGFIAEQTNKHRFEPEGFKAIVDRFTVDLIETMLGHTLGSDARKARFQNGKRELLMLSLFSDSGIPDNPCHSDLVAYTLTQKLAPKTVADRPAYSDLVHQALADKGLLSADLFDKAQGFLNLCLTKNFSEDSVLSLISNLVVSPNPMAKASAIKKLIDKVGDNNESDEDTYITSLLKDVYVAKSESDVKDEIERDVENLVFLFKDCVISAIALELQFSSAITHYIDRVKGSLNNEAGDYRKFLRNNIHLIKYAEHARINDMNSRSEITKRIIEDMESLTR